MPGPTPYVIQPGDIIYGYNLGDGNQGPFEHGGAIYEVLSVFDAVTQVAIRTGVFKSTDSGVTFTEQDIPGAPTGGIQDWFSSCFYPSSAGNILYILTQQGVGKFSNPLSIFSFNMATDTWTSIATGGPNAGASAPNQLLARTSTGTFVAFYTDTSSGTGSVLAVTCSSAGVWGTPHLLQAGSLSASNFVNLMGIDNADTVVMTWDSQVDAQYYVATWTSGGGFSAKSVAFPYSTPWNDNRYDLGQGWNAQGKFVAAENKIGWCLPFFPTPSTIQPTMLTADMSVSPPVFATVVVASDINADEDTFWTDFCISPDGLTLTSMWTWQGPGPGNTPNQVLQSTSPALVGPWAAESVYWDKAVDPPVTPPPQAGGLNGENTPNSISVRQLSFGVRAMIGLFPVQAGTDIYQGQFHLSVPAPPPPVVLSNGGGRGFVRVVLNHFDSCLGREYLLYQLINRELLKCGVKPFCFCFNERDWGGNFSEHEEVPMGPPEGAIAFNPTGQLVLPTAASGDNVIFQTRVPIGYDGVILGQYHGYIPDPTAMPVPFFVQGGGDIVWRLEAAGRCVRDCGIMEVSIGSLQNMAPVAGGLQVRSGNLIQYIVAVPNTSGALTPGVGNIVAGLHGYYWPRK